jgi:hypothetical protein
MNLQRAFDQGMVAGVFLMLGANAIYWFISTWTPEVNTVRTILGIIQLIVGIGVAAWFLFQRIRNTKAA